MFSQASRPLWGIGRPAGRFRDGSARGHASKRAGAQEGRQPGSTPGTRGSLPAWEGSARSCQGPGSIPPCEDGATWRLAAEWQLAHRLGVTGWTGKRGPRHSEQSAVAFSVISRQRLPTRLVCKSGSGSLSQTHNCLESCRKG